MTTLKVTCSGETSAAAAHDEIVVETFHAVYSADDGSFLNVYPEHDATAHYVLDGDLEVNPRLDDLESDARVAQMIEARGGRIAGTPADHQRYRLVCPECGDPLTLTQAQLQPLFRMLVEMGVLEQSLTQVRRWFDERGRRGVGGSGHH